MQQKKADNSVLLPSMWKSVMISKELEFSLIKAEINKLDVLNFPEKYFNQSKIVEMMSSARLIASIF